MFFTARFLSKMSLYILWLVIFLLKYYCLWNCDILLLDQQKTWLISFWLYRIVWYLSFTDVAHSLCLSTTSLNLRVCSFALPYFLYIFLIYFDDYWMCLFFSQLIMVDKWFPDVLHAVLFSLRCLLSTVSRKLSGFFQYKSLIYSFAGTAAVYSKTFMPK